MSDDEPTAAYHKGSGEIFVKTPYNPPGTDSDPRSHEAPGGWHQVTNIAGLMKWQYRDTPYRVLAYLNEDRGHWRALFTSCYSGSYLIRGNCGGDEGGMVKATLAAKKFMRENEDGCPPPGEYEG